jgi:hypothetical protein
MAEDKKKKPGLHKKISSIFEGVPLPQPGSPQPPPAAPGGPPAAGGGQVADSSQKPLPPAFQTLRAAQASRPYETAQAAPVSQPRAEAVKATGTGLWQKIKDKLLAPKPSISGTRQKVMLILVPVLFVVLIFVAISVLVPPREVQGPPQSVLATTAVGTDTNIEWKVPPPYPATLRDPMQPVPSAIIPGKTEPEKAEAVKPEKPVVKGILYSEDNPSAIIGIQIVHEGDKIAGATILKINKDCVEFEMDGKKWTQNVEP